MICELEWATRLAPWCWPSRARRSERWMKSIACSSVRDQARVRRREAQILLHPAAPNVRGIAAAIVDDLFAVAAGVHQGVGEKGHPFELAIVVDDAGQVAAGGR